MKRLAILLASAALGSGCIVQTTENRGDASLYWSFWETASHGQFGSLSATATEVCSKAGVDTITIVLIDPSGVALSPVSGPCIDVNDVNDVPGRTFTALQTGTWQFEIYGYRGTALVFEDVPANATENTFVVNDGASTFVDTYPAAIYGDLDLAFYVPTCISTDTVEFDVKDFDTGSVVYSTYSGVNNPPVALGCSGSTPAVPATMVIPSVPAARYDLVNLAQVANPPAPTPPYDVHYPACVPNWTQGAGGAVLPTITIDTSLAPAAYCP